MGGFTTKIGNLAARSLVDPVISKSSMASIAPQFVQAKNHHSYEASIVSRFRMPGWVRTLADFFTPEQQAAAAGAPFVMQMSGKRGGSVNKPTLSKRGTSFFDKCNALKRYYTSLDDATLRQIFSEEREKMASSVRETAAWLNEEFTDFIPREVAQLDPLDVDYWEHVESCVFKPMGYSLGLYGYPFTNVSDSDNARHDDLHYLLEEVKKRMAHIGNDAAFIDLVSTFIFAFKALRVTTVDQDFTIERLEQVLDRQALACGLRPVESDSLLDPLPDGSDGYCIDPLEDD